MTETKAEIDHLVDQKVVRWRVERMVAVGIPEYKAVALACSEADYHEAIKLVDKGCPPDLVSGILL